MKITITYYLFILVFLFSANQGVSGSNPLHGVGWVKNDFTYTIQKPWDVNVNERYSYNKAEDEHRFWVYKDDKPFKQGDTTSPRCEMRIKNDYNSGNHQFEADFYAVEGSDRPCVMQIWLGFMLKISGNEEGGSYWWHQSNELMKNVYGKWVHVNIVHMWDEGKVYVYMDGELAAKVNAKITSDKAYFKCGIYTTRSEKSEVWIKNINYYVQQEGSSVDEKTKADKSPIRIENGELNIDTEDESLTKIYRPNGELLLSTSSKKINLPHKGVSVVKTEIDENGEQVVYCEKILN